jgi:multidrug efflux pump subunit AcrB
MNFSSYSIRNPSVVILVFALLMIAGLLAFRYTKVQEFPDVELPLVNVTATLESSAAQLETEVARKLEDSIATLQGIKHIYTTVRDGEVNIRVEFILERDPAEAVNDVRDAVAQVRSDLPSDLREPSVTKVSTAGRVVVVFSVASDRMDQQDLGWFVDNAFTKRLLSVPGVGSVKTVGAAEREVRVELDADRMAALNISAADVSRRLRLIQQEASGGRGDVSGAEQSVRTIATVKTAAELAQIQVSMPDGRRIRLDQVATVSDAIEERRSYALQDGKAVVGVEIFRSRGASEIEVASDVKAAAAKLVSETPHVTITPIIDNSTSVQENFDGSMHLLYEGAILAVLVVWWFLRDWRATLVAAAALPLSVIPAFLGMYYFGYTLNTVTLLSLALVVGILVDDAIVEIENISRHLKMGKTPYQAAMEAADEIGLAVIATTFALVAVFLPTAFMGGIAGMYFKQFGWTAVLAILASLLVARLITPMMAAYILKPFKQKEAAAAQAKGVLTKPETAKAAAAHAGHDEGPDSWIMTKYLEAMKWCLRHRRITAIAAFLFFAGSVSLAGLLPTGFLPAADRGQTQINIELPPGSTLRETLAVESRTREILASVPHVQSVFSSVGGGSSGDAFTAGAAAEVRRAVLTVTLAHRDDREESMMELEAIMRERLVDVPGARFQVGPPESGTKMQVVLRSEDTAALAEAAKAAERDLRTLQGIGAVTSSASLVRPEIVIRPDFDRAADLGVTSSSIGEVVRIATSGDFDKDLTKLNLPDRQIPVRVRLPDAVRADLDAIGRLTVPGADGPVLLANVADITIESGPAEIARLDRSRNVTLDVELGSRSLGELYQQALQLPSLKELPASVEIMQLGDTQEMNDLFISFGIAMAVGVFCIYGVLVLLFKDFMQPITILVALPLSIGGAFVALLLTGRALSMPSMIGLIMLMGIVTKNSILLVEYAMVARREGKSRFDALVDACHKRSQPIVMTSIAMGAGMLPLALGMGAEPSFRSPMAIAVIGGLITSTLLSLLVVPAVFTYVDDIEQVIGKLFRKGASDSAGEGHGHETAAPHSSPAPQVSHP